MTPSASLVAFRYGLGLPLARRAPRTADEMLARLAGPDRVAKAWPIGGMAELGPLLQAIRLRGRAAKTDPAVQAEVEAFGAQVAAIGQNGLRASLARLLDAEDAFRERLVGFWADHFTVSAGGDLDQPMVYAVVEDAIRPNLTQPFAAMLQAVTFHPAMLGYLDQNRSVGPGSRVGKRKGLGLNENLARELLELHTLGVEGGYSQPDVRQLAELLTGLRYDDRRADSFDPKMVEPGPETVLGQSYDGVGDAPIRAVLADLAVHPDTAHHISRKLAVHFLADSPDPRLAEAMARAWLDTGGDLMAVYTAFLAQPGAWAEGAEKVRQPYEYLIAALRALGVTGADLMAWEGKQLRDAMLRPMRAMGQIWKSPRGPDGWPEEAEAWVTPQAMAERIAWAMNWPSRLVKPLPLPVDLARAALGDRAAPAVIWAAERAENRAEGVGIVLASPAFNRR